MRLQHKTQNRSQSNHEYHPYPQPNINNILTFVGSLSEMTQKNVENWGNFFDFFS